MISAAPSTLDRSPGAAPPVAPIPPADSRLQVSLNARFLAQKVTGVQRYAREVSSRMPGLTEIVPGPRWRGPRGHLWEQAVLPARVGKSLLWSPGNTGPLAVSKQVVTVHDAAFFDSPEGFSGAFAAWYRWLVPQLCRRVRKVITVSEFSRDRLAETCRVPAEKFVVIYEGADRRFVPQTPEKIAAVRAQLGLPERYVLCVGSLEPRKNLRRLLAAWRQVQPHYEGLSLLLVGGAGHVFRDAGLNDLPPGVILSGYLADEHLPAVYAGAEMFVYPSVYEGFGLPVLEAMSCATPVVTSNVASLPEVAGSAGVLVEPTSVESIAAGIRQLLDDSALRDELRRKGVERARRFSWEQAAAETWQVLVEAAE